MATSEMRPHVEQLSADLSGGGTIVGFPTKYKSFPVQTTVTARTSILFTARFRD